jgi:hypothetical protein
LSGLPLDVWADLVAIVVVVGLLSTLRDLLWRMGRRRPLFGKPPRESGGQKHSPPTTDAFRAVLSARLLAFLATA